MEETLTPIQGRVTASVAGQERILGPGDTVRVAPGQTHTWRPTGHEDVKILFEARPGDRFEAMWRQFMGLTQDGKVHGNGVPSFLQIAMISREFSDVTQIAGIPRVVQRVLFALLAPVARLRGCKGAYEEYLTRGPNAVVALEPLPSHLESGGAVPSATPLGSAASGETR